MAIRLLKLTRSGDWIAVHLGDDFVGNCCRYYDGDWAAHGIMPLFPSLHLAARALLNATKGR